MSGIGSVGGQGPIYPEYAGSVKTPWDGKLSGDFKKDLETAVNVMGDLISKIKNGTYKQMDVFPVLEKLYNFVGDMSKQYANKITANIYPLICVAFSSVDLALSGLRKFGNPVLPEVGGWIEISRFCLDAILQNVK